MPFNTDSMVPNRIPSTPHGKEYPENVSTFEDVDSIWIAEQCHRGFLERPRNTGGRVSSKKHLAELGIGW